MNSHHHKDLASFLLGQAIQGSSGLSWGIIKKVEYYKISLGNDGAGANSCVRMHHREGSQKVEKFAFGSARLCDFLVRFALLSPSTFGGIQSYKDFHLNANIWLMFGLLFRLPTIALSTNSRPTLP